MNPYPYNRVGPLELIHYKDANIPAGPPIHIDGIAQYKGLPKSKYYGSFVSIRGAETIAQDIGLSSFYSSLTRTRNYSSFLNILPYGAIGWNRFKPLRPSVDIGEDIAEMGNTFKMLKNVASDFSKSFKDYTSLSRKSLKRAGNDWLAANFGWLPFIRSMQDSYNTYKNLDKYLLKLRRDNGKWVKCSGTIDESSSGYTLHSTKITTEGRLTLFPDPGAFCNPELSSSPGGRALYYTQERRRIWFSALMKYYIDNISSPKWKFRAFGIDRLTPSLLYQVTPWSWLIDYFSNVGDVISNLSSANEVVAKNACVMGYRVMDVKVEDFCRSSTSFPNPFITDYSFEMKCRATASPFGFGLTGDTLSPRQLGILSALGLSRLF